MSRLEQTRQDAADAMQRLNTIATDRPTGVQMNIARLNLVDAIATHVLEHMAQRSVTYQEPHENPA